jgi:hypothetical protein
MKNSVISIVFFLIMAGMFVALPAKPRVIILTDISPPDQEPDDIESMVRLLLYSNELDIEGLIATSSCWRANDPVRPDLITDLVSAYGEVRQNLIRHAQGYPGEQQLKDLVREGNGHGMVAVGAGRSTPGSELIREVVDREDTRPVWVCIWGGAATLAQTLHDVREERDSVAIDTFVSRLRICELAGQDDAGAWICHNFTGIFFIRSQVQWRGFSYRVDNLWPESRGGDEHCVAPEWFEEHVISGHGPLGAVYPQAKYLYEGDTPTFLNLLCNGLSEPDSVYYGGWGGRFAPKKKMNVGNGSDNASIDDYLNDHPRYSQLRK